MGGRVQNILFIHQSAELYGSDKVLLLICSELVKTKQYHPIVIVPEDGPLIAELKQNGVEVHTGCVSKISRSVFSPAGLVRLTFSLLRGCRDINRVLDGRDVTVVHSNTLAVFSGVIWAFLKRKRHIWHVHEIILSPRIVSRIFPRLVSWFSDLAMSNSSLTEQWLLQEQPQLSERSVVIFNGLPPTELPTDAEVATFRQLAGVTDDVVLISLVGRVNKWKGQDLLLQAAILLQQRELQTPFKIAIIGNTVTGQESLLEDLKQQVDAVGLASHVVFIPFLQNVLPAWHGSQIAVIPSTEPEPFGMVAIEAMAAGVPVVAAAHGGLLDIVCHDESGLLFTPRDAMALANALSSMIKSPELRSRLGAAGRQRQADYFSLDTQVKQTMKAYQKVMS